MIARELADREGFRERFLRESRLAARLDHPAVVPVYDSREVDGELIVAMRLVEGGDLRKLIERAGPLPPERAVALLGQVGEALDAAHAAGIVHRDVKPHNVLVEGDRAFLSDFGLAKALDEGGGSSASVVGTAEYMSPEQWGGGPVGPAADIYSLGCVLYEALTGIAPFARKEADTEPEMPRGLDEVIERAVAKDPDERYASAGALIAAARARQGDTPAATRVLSASAERPTQPLGRSRRPAGARAAASSGGAGPALAALAGILALALVLLGGDGVEVSAPIAVGRPPLRIAAAPEAIWVTSETDGTLTRLDPASGEPLGKPFTLGAGIAGVAFGAGSVWVADPPPGEVLRVDPESGAVLRRIDVGGHPAAIVFGAGRVWVADSDGGGVSAIEARGNAVIRRGIGTHAAPLRLAVGSRRALGEQRLDRLAAAHRPRTLRLGRGILVGRGPAGVTVAGGLVWVANSRGDTVSTVDTTTQVVVGEQISVGEQPGGIDAGTSTVWVAITGEDAVARIDLESGEQAGGTIGVGPEPGAVAVGQTRRLGGKQRRRHRHPDRTLSAAAAAGYGNVASPSAPND